MLRVPSSAAAPPRPGSRSSGVVNGAHTLNKGFGRGGMGSLRTAVSCRAVATWTREDIMEMMEETELAKERLLGEEWREYLGGDTSDLLNAHENAVASWAETLELAKSMSKQEYEESGLQEPLHRFPGPMASDLLGMGTWRLKDRTDPAVEFMVSRIEGAWRELCYHDLNLYPPAKWKAKGMDFCDSMDPNRELKGFAYVDVPDPKKGEEGYPRMLLENRVYSSKVFRKLHLEVAWRQDGLHVMHAVLYPRYNHDLPILAMDVVVAGGAVTLAIIDACPSRGMRLPQHYMQMMKELQEECLTDPNNQRAIPEWGKRIFSPLCICMRPQDPAEFAGFMRYAQGLHRAHMMLAKLSQPLEEGHSKQIDLKLKELLEGHKSFVENQLANKKTRRMLDAAFNPEWSKEYMEQIMFDFDPSDEPPADSFEVADLYEYFDANPEFGSLGEEMAKLEDKQQLERAEQYIDQAVYGPSSEEQAPVSFSKVAWALEKAYADDPGFQETLKSLLPNADDLKANGELGKVLMEHLKEMSGESFDQNVKSDWIK